MMSSLDPVPLAQGLIRCESVTPVEGGALTLLEGVLDAAGFECHRMTFSEPGFPDVENLYARLGNTGPNLCFAGHTDVVPPGNLDAWTSPPFAAEIRAGILYGRGAVDMKGEFYDEKRLEASLDKSSALKAEQITKLVYDNVVSFAGEAEQSDDITIVALNFHGAVK